MEQPMTAVSAVNTAEEVPRLEAIQNIQTAINRHGLEPPVPTPPRMNIEELNVRSAVFQPRQLEGNRYNDERHLKILQDSIGRPEKPRYLEEIEIWWGGDRYYVIDGHHRRDAYFRAGVHHEIPVRGFRGSFEDAIARAGEANSKDRLPMSNEDKFNHAWLLTVFTKKSKAGVRKASSVSLGTVNNMRKALSVLNARGHSRADLIETTWKDAQDLLSDRQRPEFDSEGYIEQRANEIQKALYKALRDRPMKESEAFALALVKLDRRMPKLLLEAYSWSDVVEEWLEERGVHIDPDY